MSGGSNRIFTGKLGEKSSKITLCKDGEKKVKSVPEIDSIERSRQTPEKEEENIESDSENEGKPRAEEEHQGRRRNNRLQDFYLKHPFLGKRVKIIHGPGTGIVAKLIGVKSRGWWTLDHPDVPAVIHSRRCIFVDEVDEEAMIQFYRKRGMKYRTSPHLARQQTKRKRRTNLATSNEGPSQSKVDSYMADNEVLSKKKRTKTKPSESRIRKRKSLLQEPVIMSNLIASASEKPKSGAYFEGGQQELNYQDSSEIKTMSPVVLQYEKDEIPGTLKHLHPKHMLDIFDRKTGMIRSGRQRISVQDLPHVLRHHAEYEPIVPPPSMYKMQLSESRQGRSGKNVRVSAEVHAQSKSTNVIQNQEHDVSGIVKDGMQISHEGDMMNEIFRDDSCNNYQMKNSSVMTNGKIKLNGYHRSADENINEICDTDICLIFQEALAATIKEESQTLDTQIESLRVKEAYLEKKITESLKVEESTKYQEELSSVQLRVKEQKIESDLRKKAHESVEMLCAKLKTHEAKDSF